MPHTSRPGSSLTSIEGAILRAQYGSASQFLTFSERKVSRFSDRIASRRVAQSVSIMAQAEP